MGRNLNELNIYIEHSHLYKNRCDARNNIGTIIIKATEYVENTLEICDNVYIF